MNDLRIEVRSVTDHVAGHHPHAAIAELLRQLPELVGGVSVADAGLGGVDIVASVRERRIAATVENQVALQHTADDRTGAEHGRLYREVGAQERIRDDGNDELGIAGRNEEAVGVAAIEEMPAEIGDRNPPEQVFESRCIEALVEPLGERLGGGRNGHRHQHCAQQRSHSSHRPLVDLPRRSRDP